jgi:hypothetical protein
MCQKVAPLHLDDRTLLKYYNSVKFVERCQMVLVTIGKNCYRVLEGIDNLLENSPQGIANFENNKYFSEAANTLWLLCRRI